MTDLSRGSVYRRTWQHDGRRKTAYQYSITLTVDGVARRVRGQAPTRAEALASMDRRRDELLRPQPAASAPAITLTEALSRALDLKARKSASTRRDYARIAQHLKAEFGAETQLADITAGRIAEYEGKQLAATRTIGKGESKIERPFSLAAINRPRAFLRHVLRLAQEWGELAAVPKIRCAREKGRLRWLKPEEAARLLDACRRSANKALLDLVEFALFTGVRQNEALTLEWARVDRATATALLVDTKNGEPRTVHLNLNADAVLSRRWSPEATGYVFGSRNWNSFRTAWETALRAARIENFRFHDLRHTFASWAVQRGVRLQEVKDLLGHKSITMTLRYAHLAPENLRAAVSALDDVLPATAPTELVNEMELVRV